MVVWWKKYVNSEPFIKQYDDKFSIDLIAEATFLAVDSGLDTYIKKMSYSEIRQFHPIEIMMFEDNDFAKSIKNVSSKMKNPSMSYEVSYALGQAAWSIFAHQHSFDEMCKLNKGPK